jgi:hypothetical protein
MQGLNRIDLIFGFLLCLIGFGPGALSSQLKASEDKAPLFLFVLNSAKASALSLPGNGVQLELQIPRQSIRSVKMYSNRSGVVFTEFRQPGVKDLWKSVNVDFKHPAKATLSAFQSSPQIIEILGLEVTPLLINYQISIVEPVSSMSPILKNVTLTMDAAATWKSCSGELPCVGYGSPLLNASVCYGDSGIRDNCPDCGCCTTGEPE